ncbi:Retrovirus-related Pol polyprotein from transposon 17.6 [Vitis vinifera]|uniref:RNA-directed DNA polymerase n=1 Tax=Vitis vinifera TaxID=29760 RepID=A0A438DTA3_VITVI|nr:Retrovirus-related Pol polyprotein from transposon 17.6 [Vitis vinifera]
MEYIIALCQANQRCKEENQRKKSNNQHFCMAVRNFAHHAKPLKATKGFRTPCQLSHESNGLTAMGTNQMAPLSGKVTKYIDMTFVISSWIRDIERKLVKIETPRETELEVCLNIMDVPPEDQNSQHGQEDNFNAYQSMRDRMHPPRMSAPSCIVPPTEQLIIRPHIVPLLPTFHGIESENPYSHIKEFEEGLPRSIRTWTDLQAEFLKKFFPTHRTNGLKRQILNFSAKENEKFYECWERYMEVINACPHHGFDTWLLVSYFYDGMSFSMKQLLETMCGGDFMSKNTEEAMDFLNYVARVSRGWDEPNPREVGRMKSQPNAKGGMYVLNKDIDMKAKVAAMARRLEELEMKKVQEVQAISETSVQAMPCSICQSYEHLVEECPTIPAPPQYTQPTQAPQQASNLEQAIVNLSKVVGDFVGDQKSINAQLNQRIDSVENTLKKIMDGMQNDLSQKIDNVQYTISRLTNLNTMQKKGKFPSQPQQNPKGIHEVEAQEGESSKVREVKAVITLRSGKEVDQPTSKLKHDEESVAKKKRDLCTIKRGLNVNKKAFLTEQVSAIIQCKSPVKYKDLGCPTISMSIRGTCVEKALLALGASVNLLPYSVYKQLGLGELKPTSITLSLAYRSVKIPRGMIKDVLVQVDKFYYPVDFVVLDTDPVVKGTNYVPIILGRPFLATSNAIINCRNGVMQLTFGNMTLELNIFHLYKKHIHPEEKEELKYAYLEEDKQFPIVISSALTIHQEDCLLEVLRRCKKAIGWKISNLKGISPLVCTHHIYMEDEATPVRQPQRRLNPHIQEVVRAKVLKLLQAGEDVSTHLTTGWRVCINYRKLNAVTRNNHFPLPFMDQVLKRVSGHPFYCFLDGYSGYFQIEIDVEDQEKTTFTCPFGTHAYKRMSFGLCNAPATFQRCMLSIFSDMVERIMEVFMDDITIYGSTFDECLVNLEAVLNRCIEKDLVLNWEKCHFMVHQGIVLGHSISKEGIEVDKAKVELIVKLPSPTKVKGVRQFLGHVGFYKRFIKDFSKLARPLCELLVKDAKFIWDDRCQRSFEELKLFLTTAPIVRAPKWQLPFEVMCDASDFAIGVVLGQREDGKPYVIYYASKTLNEAQRNYTTTEKKFLATVFALDKFHAYLVGSFIVVFTDHSTLKYLLTKQDAKARLIRWIILLQEFNL